MIVNIISESVLFPNYFGGLHTAFLNNIALLRWKKVAVKVNSVSDADITHIHSFGPFAFYKLVTSKRTVVSTHVIPATMSWTFKGNKYWGNIFKKYLIFFYNHADLVLALHTGVKEELQELGVVKRMEVLANALDTNLFTPDKDLRLKGRKLLGIKKDAYVILGTGSLMRRKGIKDFIALARALPKFTFVWVGDNTSVLFHSDVKRSYFGKNKPSNLLMSGSFPYKDMPAIYNAADILFFPSYQEIASMAILEAAACGLPLILRDIPEYRFLYDKSYRACKTDDAFKKAIIQLVDNEKDYEKARMTSLALAQKYSMETLGSKLLSYYEELLQKK